MDLYIYKKQTVPWRQLTNPLEVNDDGILERWYQPPAKKTVLMKTENEKEKTKQSPLTQLHALAIINFLPDLDIANVHHL